MFVNLNCKIPYNSSKVIGNYESSIIISNQSNNLSKWCTIIFNAEALRNVEIKLNKSTLLTKALCLQELKQVVEVYYSLPVNMVLVSLI